MKIVFPRKLSFNTSFLHVFVPIEVAAPQRGTRKRGRVFIFYAVDILTSFTRSGMTATGSMKVEKVIASCPKSTLLKRPRFDGSKAGQ